MQNYFPVSYLTVSRCMLLCIFVRPSTENQCKVYSLSRFYRFFFDSREINGVLCFSQIFNLITAPLVSV